MATINNRTKAKNLRAIMGFLIVAAGLCLFLFFIDEGHYSFQGMMHPSNLLGLGLYFALFLGIQLLVYWFVSRKLQFGLSIFLPILVLAVVMLAFWLLII